MVEEKSKKSSVSKVKAKKTSPKEKEVKKTEEAGVEVVEKDGADQAAPTLEAGEAGGQPSLKDLVSQPSSDEESLNASLETQEASSRAKSAVASVVGRPQEMAPRPMRPAARPVAAKPISPEGNIEIINGRKVWRSSRPITRPNFGGDVDGRILPDAGLPTEEFTGLLDLMRDGNGVLRGGFRAGDKDAYISGTQIRRFRLRAGDEVAGPARKPKENEQYWGLLKVEKINGFTPEEIADRVNFGQLTPVYPDTKLMLETDKETQSTRMIDLVAPVGRGQRGMIVSPPKAGKTTILKDIATGVALNYKDVHLMAVLIGERPEEVTDIRRHIEKVTDGKGEVAASNFDEQATEQVRAAELALERAKRLVELGRHVVIIMDSITRLARAYNLAIPTSGRTLSGGFDPAALYPPKRFFGAARNFESFQTVGGEKSGSLTILGTALIDTGSKMDDLIYEEFKGTGNMELHLDRKLAERRIFPAIDIQRSGTRKEELLFSNSEYQSVVLLRRMVDMLDPKEHTAVIISRMKNTKNNKEFLASLKEG